MAETQFKRADIGEPPRLIPYKEVRRTIEAALSGFIPLQERVPVDSALGRISAEDVHSDRSIPAVDSSAMDGYAVRFSELKDACPSHPSVFRVKSSLSPGSRQPRRRLGPHETYYVATGAPVPPGADVVVKVEEARLSGEDVLVSLSVPRWKNIVPCGEDVRKGATLVRRGQIVSAPDIALLVAMGRRELRVFRKPRVGIVSTGDELSPPGSRAKWRKVNNYSNLVAAYLSDSGASPVPLGIVKDDLSSIVRLVEKRFADLDAFVTIGGSSLGRRDFTSRALKSMGGCKELFHGVRLVPVKPTGMYMVRGKPVVLLPGHSVAASISFFLVVRPTVNILSGLQFDSRTPLVDAALTEKVTNSRPLGAVYLVKLVKQGGAYSATPLRWGSNLISSLASANGYVQTQPHTASEAGSAVTVALLGGSEILRIPGEPS